MKKLIFAFLASQFIFPSMAKADLVYFLGLKPSGPIHLMAFDTVDGTYTIAVKELHSGITGINFNSNLNPVFDPKSRNIHYVFRKEDANGNGTTFLRSVNIDTKNITDKEFGLNQASGEGYGVIGPIFQTLR